MPDNRYENTSRPGQEHFVAPPEDVRVGVVDAVDTSEAPSSLWGDAWRDMRHRPLFWASAALIVLVILMATIPSLFTSTSPTECHLESSLAGPAAGHIFGFDKQGCDIYARAIYGARASVTVGVLSTVFVVVVGTIIGSIAGYFGGWLDTLLSRFTDIFFAVPFVLAAIVIMSLLQNRNALVVAIVLATFGWTSIARITRGAVLGVKNNEFITAAKALGMGRLAILAKHVLPNAAAPIIVYATVALGTFIVAEATLSFLGIGLPTSTVSWGGDLDKAQVSIRVAPEIMIYPATALALTVLSFIMMGDVVRDALDPKARKR
ncbi:ABC transporter permease [Promicromonospora thailandica]|uniref:Oligopeptide transport system permease protein n=1 Tax=Promicromonospora thailandica TaxID=765201 RepID=A0A9X2JWK4_9MICO|nr:ABC transporter permease [Promicromonospora thailandica]MCP2266236.1 oligopeptide transport system permease protein [Promicromonospora thailandica]BFF20726.1 ABC transporter permease [Promicromonospora thailandica]